MVLCIMGSGGGINNMVLESLLKKARQIGMKGYWIYGRRVTEGEFLDDLVKEFPKAKKATFTFCIIQKKFSHGGRSFSFD